MHQTAAAALHCSRALRKRIGTEPPLFTPPSAAQCALSETVDSPSTHHFPRSFASRSAMQEQEQQQKWLQSCVAIMKQVSFVFNRGGPLFLSTPTQPLICLSNSSGTPPPSRPPPSKVSSPSSLHISCSSSPVASASHTPKRQPPPPPSVTTSAPQHEVLARVAQPIDAAAAAAIAHSSARFRTQAPDSAADPL